MTTAHTPPFSTTDASTSINIMRLFIQNAQTDAREARHTVLELIGALEKGPFTAKTTRFICSLEMLHGELAMLDTVTARLESRVAMRARSHGDDPTQWPQELREELFQFSGVQLNCANTTRMVQLRSWASKDLEQDMDQQVLAEFKRYVRETTENIDQSIRAANKTLEMIQDCAVAIGEGRVLLSSETPQAQASTPENTNISHS